jgi:hypothetical protein
MRPTATGSLTSAWAETALLPVASILATSASASALPPAKLTTTANPSAARRVAIAAPMPRDAPVTIATLFAVEPIFVLHLQVSTADIPAITLPKAVSRSTVRIVQKN